MAEFLDNEKRRFPRMLYKFPLRYQILGTSQFTDVIADNISTKGAGFVNERFLPTATPVKVEISLQYRVIRSEGKVAWSSTIPHSDRCRLGIEFNQFNPKDLEYLNDFLNNYNNS